jgi:hypothetical protein
VSSYNQTGFVIAALLGDVRGLVGSLNSKGSKNTGYIYSNINWPEGVTWTIGLSIDDYEARSYAVENFNPKFGLQWQISDDIRIRFSAFRSLKPALINNRTIEPTQIAGFSQFLDDPPGTVSWSYGVGLDARLTANLYGGVEFRRRDLEVPLFFVSFDPEIRSFPENAFSEVETERDEDLYRAYLFWTPGREWAVSSEVQLDFF